MFYTCSILSFFSLQNAVCFIMLTCLFSVLFTFYIQHVVKLKNNSGAKGLMLVILMCLSIQGLKMTQKESKHVVLK